MDRTERFYKIDQLLSDRGNVTFDELIDELSISSATLKRDLEYMRNRLNAPIVWDRELRAYCFDKTGGQTGARYELPGLWFNASEIHALLTMQHLLSGIDSGGLLGPHIQPLAARLHSLLEACDNKQHEIRKRVKIIGQQVRRIPVPQFEIVGSALLHRNRLAIQYFARSTNEDMKREVSPQRLVYYRENWYLDAWCHTREGLRSFSMDSVRSAEILNTSAKEIAAKVLDEQLAEGYGIFAGNITGWAVLKFTAERGRWIAAEQWHPKQRSRFEEDGSFLLEVPYSDHRELMMDILKHGFQVEVVAPVSLRLKVEEEIKKMARIYCIGPN